MRSKNILSIAAFTIAFSFSVVIASLFITKTYPTTYEVVSYSSGSTCSKRHYNQYQSPTAREITELIRQDKSNGRERSKNTYGAEVNFRPAFESARFADYVESVEEYVDESSSLDVSELPRDFQQKWAKHMKAWRNYSDFLNEIKSSDFKKSKIETLVSADDVYSEEINQTWYEVLELGVDYGADVH